jgi:histidinol-phosphate aminotransferase
MSERAVSTPRPRAAVERMKEYHPPLGNRDGLRLDFNENTLACSPRVIEALGRVVAGDLTRYPERETVEGTLATHLGLDKEEVLLTNGVDEAIHLVCQAFLDRDDVMLLPVPTYSMYEVYASASDGRVETVFASDDFKFPHAAMLEAIGPETKLICIANPNSPTGATVTRQQILEIVEKARHAIVLVDEAYFHFFGETMIDLVRELPNLVVARTFSKAYGLAGLRLGMLAAAKPVMHWLRRVISPYSVNSLALACLPAALDDREYLESYVSEVKQAGVCLLQALDELGVRYWPTAANFVLTEIGSQHAEFVSAMRKRGVLTRDRSADPGCDGCVRITIGTREQMASAIVALRESLAEIAWEKQG